MTPAKGYAKMKDSGIEWVGMIPAHWGICKIKYTVTQETLRAENNGGYIGLENVESWSGKIIDKHNENVVAEGASLAVCPNDILFGKLRPYLAKCAIAEKSGCCSTEFIVMRPHSIEGRFLKYVMLTPQFIDMVNMSTYGAKMPRANWDFIGNALLAMPSRDEQAAIASYLDAQCAKIDEIIAEAKASMEDYKQWKASIIYEAVTKGLDPNVEMKDSGIEWIGRMPVHWACQKVCRCFDVIGSGTTPKSLDDDYYSGKIPWLQSGDINGWYVEETSKHITTEALNTFSALKIYEAPFIAVAMYGASIANTSIVYLDACTNQACCVLSNPAEKIEFEYIFYAILASKEELLLSARGGTQPNISQEIIKQLKLPIPPQKEQQRIITYLHKKVTEIGRLVGEKQTLIDDLESYKKSLIYEVVTGKRRVY